MVHQEFDFQYHNTNLYGQYWQCPKPKAVILLVHGMGEHSNRYTDFVIPNFLKKNISVITYDQFGHGKTLGKRGHNPGFEALLDCIEILLQKANKLFNKIPTFLYGHSMGGNLAINYTLRRKNELKGIIATSPFLRLAFQPPKWKIKIGKLLHKITPSITMNSGLEVEAISRNKNEVDKYKSDPLIHNKVSPSYSLTIMETGKWAIKNASMLKTPLLILHGTGDRLTSYKASEEFANNNTKQVELKLFQGGYHELHNDLCRDEVLKTIINWIYKQLKINA